MCVYAAVGWCPIVVRRKKRGVVVRVECLVCIHRVVVVVNSRVKKESASCRGHGTERESRVEERKCGRSIHKRDRKRGLGEAGRRV